MAVSVTSDIENLVQLRLIIGIFLLVLTRFGFCSDSSSFSSKNLDPKDSDHGSFVHTSNYIMKSYYEKYEILDDMDYKNFVARELPLGPCDASPDNLSPVPRLLDLERELAGEGSHRRIYSSVKIRVGPEPLQCSCALIVIERLPLGVFADPFELQDLLRRGAYGDIAVFGDTNLESPSLFSNRSAVEIRMNVGPGNDVDVRFDLPLHARYAPLNETGYSHVRIDAPDLFLRCGVEGKSGGQGCLYRVENNSEELRHREIIWKIPSGVNSHSRVVYVFTFVSASLAALVIVWTSICSSNVSRNKSLKLS